MHMRIITGAFKGRALHTVRGEGYRPAMGRVRESLFSLLEARGVVWSGVRVLDLFAGSGSLGFEALSRGAVEAVFVEKDADAAACLRKNAEMLGVTGKAMVMAEDAVKVANRRPPAQFEVIFVDPPYRLDVLKQVLRGLMKNAWLAEGGYLIFEVEKHYSFPEETEDAYGLELDSDRAYGQTRLLIWTAK